MPEFNVAEIKAHTDLLQLVQRDTHLKKEANTGGGEFAGPCPFCGGTDRFRLQLKAPAGKVPQGQRWMCRQCSEKWGDLISYYMKRNQVDFTEACRRLSGSGPADTPLQPRNTAARPLAPQLDPQVNREIWQRTGREFVSMCEELLWKPAGAAARNYLNYRGLTDETLQAWHIGYCPENGHMDGADWGFAPGYQLSVSKGIVIPCEDSAGLHYIKLRRHNLEPKYINLAGGEMWPFGLSTFCQQLIAVLFEGEFDALLAWQTGFNVGYASLPAGQNWIEQQYEPFFETVEDAFVCFDEDEAGYRAAAKLTQVHHFHRMPPLPYGKDLTEFRLLGGNVLDWIYDALDITL